MNHRNKHMRHGETTSEAFARVCREFLRGCSMTRPPFGDGDPRDCKECRKAFLRAVVGIGKGPEVERVHVSFESGEYFSALEAYKKEKAKKEKEETHDE